MTLSSFFAPSLYHAVFEFLEGGEVLDVPTETPLDEKSAWLAFRDVVLGLEYRECWPTHETLSRRPHESICSI